jgi:hypothetical protein
MLLRIYLFKPFVWTKLSPYWFTAWKLEIPTIGFVQVIVTAALNPSGKLATLGAKRKNPEFAGNATFNS